MTASNLLAERLYNLLAHDSQEAEPPEGPDPNAVWVLYDGDYDSWDEPGVVQAVFRSEGDLRRYVEREVRAGARRVDGIRWYHGAVDGTLECWWLGLWKFERPRAKPRWNLVDHTYKRWPLMSVETGENDAPSRNPLAE